MKEGVSNDGSGLGAGPGLPQAAYWNGPVSRLWAAVYRTRADVQRAIPDPLGKDRERFRAWAAQFGLREMGIDVRLGPSTDAGA